MYLLVSMSLPQVMYIRPKGQKTSKGNYSFLNSSQKTTEKRKQNYLRTHSSDIFGFLPKSLMLSNNILVGLWLTFESDTFGVEILLSNCIAFKADKL